jgi:hypothetical protein
MHVDACPARRMPASGLGAVVAVVITVVAMVITVVAVVITVVAVVITVVAVVIVTVVIVTVVVTGRVGTSGASSFRSECLCVGERRAD